MTAAATRLRLLMKPECTLCEEMARDLAHLQVAFDTIDIERDARLRLAYAEVIPVLMHGDMEIARAPQDVASLRRTLQGAGFL